MIYITTCITQLFCLLALVLVLLADFYFTQGGYLAFIFIALATLCIGIPHIIAAYLVEDDAEDDLTTINLR